MSAFRFGAARGLGIEGLTALYNRAFEGYLVPVHLEPAVYAECVRAWDLDLDGSRVAFEGDRPVALAMLGVRGRRGWVGGMGVIPERRGLGLGRAVLEALLAEARTRGVAEVDLEVLEPNVVAAGLYERMGFRDRRVLDVWSRAPGAPAPAAPDRPAAAPLPADEALAAFDALHPERPPWQRERRSLAELRESLAALAVPGPRGPAALALYRVRGPAMALHALAAAADAPPAARAAVLAALIARHDGAITLANLPAGDPAGADLRVAGFALRLRQREMTRAL